MGVIEPEDIRNHLHLWHEVDRTEFWTRDSVTHGYSSVVFQWIWIKARKFVYLEAETLIWNLKWISNRLSSSCSFKFAKVSLTGSMFQPWNMMRNRKKGASLLLRLQSFRCLACWLTASSVWYELWKTNRCVNSLTTETKDLLSPGFWPKCFLWVGSGYECSSHVGAKLDITQKCGS